MTHSNRALIVLTATALALNAVACIEGQAIIEIAVPG
jgi:hypothetical protein